MRRADRLFRLVQILRDGRLHRSADLARKMEVSQRTIYRDIADLMASGVPIEGEAGVGYIMGAGFDLPPLMFTAEEVAALAAGARMLRAFGGRDMGAAAEEALSKLEAVLPEDQRGKAEALPLHAVAFRQVDSETRAHLDLIEGAILREVSLSCRYTRLDGASGERIIRPLGLYWWGEVWTLMAWCETRGDFRHFRVDRLSEIAEGAPFRPERGKTLLDLYRREGRTPP